MYACMHAHSHCTQQMQKRGLVERHGVRMHALGNLQHPATSHL